MISRDSAIEKLGPYIHDLPFDTRMVFTSALMQLVNDCGYSANIALHLVLFVYEEGMNSAQTELALRLSVDPKSANV